MALYRDDLEAAHQRIRALEDELRTREARRARKKKRPRVKQRPSGRAGAFIAVGAIAFGIGALAALGTRSSANPQSEPSQPAAPPSEAPAASESSAPGPPPIPVGRGGPRRGERAGFRRHRLRHAARDFDPRLDRARLEVLDRQERFGRSPLTSMTSTGTAFRSASSIRR